MTGRGRLWVRLASALVLAPALLLVPAAWAKDTPQAAQQLRIVALFPLTGPAASLGNWLQQGAQLAQEQVEAQHAGRLKVDLQFIDSRGKAADAVTELRAALARQRPHAVITSLSPVSRAIKPVVEQEGILTLITMTTLEDIARGTRQMVRVYANATDFTAPLANHVAGRDAKVQVLYLQDEFGRSMHDAFVASLGNRAVVTAASYEMLQKDTRSLVAAAIAARPDAVYLTGYGPAYMASLRQLRELAPHMPVLADSTFADPATLAALGSAAEGVVFTGTDNELGDAAPAQVAAFRKAFAARHGREPYSPAVFSHDAVRLLADVAWRDGKVAAPTKADVLARSPVVGVLGNIVIDAEGESSFASRLLKIDQGRIVPVP